MDKHDLDMLLIDPPWAISKGNIWKEIVSCMPKLGPAYIAAYLEKTGHHVKILDCPAERITLESLPEKLKEYDAPRFVGITSNTVVIGNAIKTAEMCKARWPNVKVVMGGIHPTVLPDEVLSSDFVDFVVRGEGEITTYELITNNPAKEIPGLSFKSNGIVHNPPRPPIKDLDSLPYPAYHLLPMKKYSPATGSYKRLPVMGIFTTRGCPGRCTYCYPKGMLRKRSAKNIMGEIKILMNEYGIKEISFYDDTFTVFKDNVKELCSIIIDEGIDVTWSCFARVDFIDEELLSIMKKAGCHQIKYGIESADEQILKNINKRINLDQVGGAIALTKKVGITAVGAFMFGNPGETEETIQKNIDFAIELDLDEAVFNITTPFPGTEMFKWAKEKGHLITEDWSKYNLSTVVMNLPTIESECIKKYYKIAYRRFYMRPRYIIERLSRIKSFVELKENMNAFFSILHAFK